MNSKTIKRSQLGGFFKLIEISATDLLPTAISELRTGEAQGIMVHNVYSKNEIEPIVEQLELHQPPFLKTSFPPIFRSWFYGRNLSMCDGDMDTYFKEATEFHPMLEELFPKELNPSQRISAILSALSNAQPVIAAPGVTDNQSYMYATLRGHDPGGYISAHCDNEFFLHSGYSHIQTIIEPHILSYVLTLAAPESGGTTEIYDYQLPAEASAIMSVDSSTEKPDITQLKSAKIVTPEGSMLIFDSGRYLHRLEPLTGNKRRWTLCSFMAQSKDKQHTYCWG